MIEPSAYFTFVIAATLIIATPGPSVFFVLARSLELGVKGGLLSVCGIALGACCHAVAVSLGVAELFKASPAGFTIVRNLGCLYLLYLGVRTWLAKQQDASTTCDKSQPRRSIVLQGFLVEWLNPKTALFFLAFLPQFASPDRKHLSLQLLFLGITFVGIGLICDSIYASVAGRLGGLLERSVFLRKAQKCFSVSVYFALGIVGFLYRIPKSNY
jgi:threonine/homoserine/homoserine lactone efflux protein